MSDKISVTFEAENLNTCLNNTRVTKEALDQLAEGAIGKPVTYEFDNTIGVVTGAEVKDGRLFMTADLFVDYLHLCGKSDGIDGSYIVPSFQVFQMTSHGDGHQVIESAEPNNFGLTDNPANLTIDPVKIKDD